MCSTSPCCPRDFLTLCIGSTGTVRHAVIRSGCSVRATGAAAALVAAARLGDRVGAVVSRGGRPDLAGDALDQIRTPTLPIVGGVDDVVIELNEEAFVRLNGPKALEIVPGASHLFPEPGALEAVIGHAARWFARHLAASPAGPRRTTENTQR